MERTFVVGAPMHRSWTLRYIECSAERSVEGCFVVISQVSPAVNLVAVKQVRIRSVGRLLVSTLVLGAALLGSPTKVEAQRSVLSVKRSALTPEKGGCPVLPPLPDSSVVTNEVRARAASLAGSARQSAIIGDEAGAHDLLAQAAALDPLESSVIYLLARSFEQRGQDHEALIQYCQYLRLERDGPDALQIRARIEELAPPAESTIAEPALTAYRNGLAQFDLGRLDQAEEAFTLAIRQDPNFGEAYYNRGVVYAAMDRHALAAQNLERYLTLTPDAQDSADVDRWVDLLRAPMAQFSPNAALAAGLVLPGGGQFYTRRPAFGGALLAGAIGAVAFGYYSEEIKIVCLATPPDGRCPPEQIVSQDVERPYLGAAIGVAAAVAVYGAWDAYRGARRRNELARSVIRVEGGLRTSSLNVGLPAPHSVDGRLGVEWLRLTF